MDSTSTPPLRSRTASQAGSGGSPPLQSSPPRPSMTGGPVPGAQTTGAGAPGPSMSATGSPEPRQPSPYIGGRQGEPVASLSPQLEQQCSVAGGYTDADRLINAVTTDMDYLKGQVAKIEGIQGQVAEVATAVTNLEQTARQRGQTMAVQLGRLEEAMAEQQTRILVGNAVTTRVSARIEARATTQALQDLTARLEPLIAHHRPANEVPADADEAPAAGGEVVVAGGGGGGANPAHPPPPAAGSSAGDSPSQEAFPRLPATDRPGEGGEGLDQGGLVEPPPSDGPGPSEDALALQAGWHLQSDHHRLGVGADLILRLEGPHHLPRPQVVVGIRLESGIANLGWVLPRRGSGFHIRGGLHLKAWAFDYEKGSTAGVAYVENTIITPFPTGVLGGEARLAFDFLQERPGLGTPVLQWLADLARRRPASESAVSLFVGPVVGGRPLPWGPVPFLAWSRQGRLPLMTPVEWRDEATGLLRPNPFRGLPTRANPGNLEEVSGLLTDLLRASRDLGHQVVLLGRGSRSQTSQLSDLQAMSRKLGRALEASDQGTYTRLDRLAEDLNACCASLKARLAAQQGALSDRALSEVGLPSGGRCLASFLDEALPAMGFGMVLTLVSSSVLVLVASATLGGLVHLLCIRFSLQRRDWVWQSIAYGGMAATSFWRFPAQLIASLQMGSNLLFGYHHYTKGPFLGALLRGTDALAARCPGRSTGVGSRASLVCFLLLQGAIFLYFNQGRLRRLAAMQASRGALIESALRLLLIALASIAISWVVRDWLRVDRPGGCGAPSEQSPSGSDGPIIDTSTGPIGPGPARAGDPEAFGGLSL